jgi:cobalt-zinc-cadmium resistance protein CzcA
MSSFSPAEMTTFAPAITIRPVQVLVAMRAPGLTPEELEARVTVPIELAAKGIPNLVRMRSIG